MWQKSRSLYSCWPNPAHAIELKSINKCTYLCPIGDLTCIRHQVMADTLYSNMPLVWDSGMFLHCGYELWCWFYVSYILFQASAPIFYLLQQSVFDALCNTVVYEQRLLNNNIWIKVCCPVSILIMSFFMKVLYSKYWIDVLCKQFHIITHCKTVCSRMLENHNNHGKSAFVGVFGQVTWWDTA